MRPGAHSEGAGGLEAPCARGRVRTAAVVSPSPSSLWSIGGPRGRFHWRKSHCIPAQRGGSESNGRLSPPARLQTDPWRPVSGERRGHPAVPGAAGRRPVAGGAERASLTSRCQLRASDGGVSVGFRVSGGRGTQGVGEQGLPLCTV